MNYLVVITARGGSKGIPKKNIKLLNGKPLIQYSIDIAKKIADKKDICFTTDNDEIIEVAQKLGLEIPFKRPAELATDTSNSQDVILHGLEAYEKLNNKTYDAIVLLQPTSPFRTLEQVQDCINRYDNSIDMVVSAKQASANPYYNLYEENNGFLKPSKEGNYTRRQDCPDVWELNGAIYVINSTALRTQKIKAFSKVKKYIMSEETSIDIDTPLDWKIAEFYLQDSK
ncbi:acylneuraminate cytidylyltransferase family protein [Winogradskyella psychrotolerans]|uniref:acylneuraminate cytidylyltransferase family protein n=1 Tax=Winogradskyella psychrotolerans TaxID=1344585 RepID=UPI001C074CB0|nr:acylneuraminate cytidylyltransferase family protein [Winogradskyella psychrotolerans]MBU2920904.1 acylneuraminate cytidylyltransferase family protein [Winogradskyella psychrotolerans]